jgi:hypothetical protein
MGVAVGILLISHLQPEIYISDLAAAILDFQLPVASHSIPYSFSGLLDPRNIRLGVEISIPASIQAKIHWFLSRLHDKKLSYC